MGEQQRELEKLETKRATWLTVKERGREPEREKLKKFLGDNNMYLYTVNAGDGVREFYSKDQCLMDELAA